jgi:GxxExxY protein
MTESDLEHHELTYSIIGAFYRVSKKLGFGYLESMYVAALEHELRKRGHNVQREFAVRVYYDGVEIGFHRLDMVVDSRVVVEIKATQVLHPIAIRQLLSYLRATNLEVGLLLHFGPVPKHSRVYVPNGKSA